MSVAAQGTIITTRGDLADALKTARAGRSRRRISKHETVVVRGDGSAAWFVFGGSEVRIAGDTADLFSVSMPLWLFKQMVESPRPRGAPLRIVFAPGQLEEGGVLQRHPDIQFGSPEPRRPAPAVRPATAAEPQGAPRLASKPTVAPGATDMLLQSESPGKIYAYFCTAPPGTTPGSPTLIRTYRTAMDRVARASASLRPLGITEEEIQGLIVRKYGGFTSGTGDRT